MRGAERGQITDGSLQLSEGNDGRHVLQEHEPWSKNANGSSYLEPYRAPPHR
ncbi:MAG: hypothetical protein WBF75_07690 [Pseudonocardiaceae bacterium]